MIRTLALHIIGNAAALYFIGQLLNGDFAITGGVKGFVIAALIFGLLNSIAKPILKILSIPLLLMTAGFFTFVINMFLVWFAKYALSVLAFEGVAITIGGGWVTYLYVGVLMSVANMVLHWLAKK